MRYILLLYLLFTSYTIHAQLLEPRLATAVSDLERDEQFRHAILSMCVADSKTGIVVFEKNAQLGLAPASCQKIITSVSAFELLGKDYRYKTQAGFAGGANDAASQRIYIMGFGDPTLGSWRFANNTAAQFIGKMKGLLPEKIKGNVTVIMDDAEWGTQIIPDGWVWEDIGNYYGAGASAFNWHENQFDVVLQAGNNIGDKVKVIDKGLHGYTWINELSTAAKGTGDNAYAYPGRNEGTGYLRGTVPASDKPITISVARQGGRDLFMEDLQKQFPDLAFSIEDPLVKPAASPAWLTNYSPALDSINYWFLKKSVNLYGEAFVKAIAYEKGRPGSTDTGIAIIKRYWKDKGIDPAALNIIDGSGLSPANRVTAHALVTILQYARKQSWFPSFYNALPEMNGIKMKDGYIGGVRSYTGYITSKNGTTYTFALIVNNFSGSAGSVREKMWKVLDLLK